MNHYDLMSYHVFKSTVFSDGKVDHDNSFFEDKRILICPHCENPFWHDSMVIGEEDYSHEDLPTSKTVMDKEFARSVNYPEQIARYYNELIHNGFATNTERETYLRILLWRSINDMIRYQQPFFKSINNYVLKRPFRFLKSRRQANLAFNRLGAIHKENLRQLCSIFDPMNDDDQLLKAEMYREAGERKKALALLRPLSSRSTRYIRKVKRATLLFQTRVFML